MDDMLKQQIRVAEPKENSAIDDINKFKNIAFDGDKRRLGWIRNIEFSLIRAWLNDCLADLADFETFIFVGIGGSGNGVKAVMSFFPEKAIFAVDSLDPAALEEICGKVTDFSKTVILPISKSGTTKETQLIAGMFKGFFGEAWKKHFIWLTDKPAFEKLDNSGWEGVLKKTIQFDGETDIGGRFSCPRTAIFILPLFLALENDFSVLERVYNEFQELENMAENQALGLAEKFKDYNPAFFHANINGPAKDIAAAWVVQLFQESLGSKRDDLQVKTVSGTVNVSDDFKIIALEGIDEKSISAMMAQMYFLQLFVAYFSAYNNLNFVAQDFVEKYKTQMRAMEGQKLEESPTIALVDLISEIEPLVMAKKFIDIVLYFHPSGSEVTDIKSAVSARFPDKLVSVYIGSDWNHHSYEAAFNDINTFFVFLTKETYSSFNTYKDKDVLIQNIETLKLISKATYATVKDKSVLFALKTVI